MEIISDTRASTGWITFRAEGRWCQAKVYDDPSCFGINDGRVSKLVIGKSPTRDPNYDFLAQMDFNYDRGIDFNHLPEGVLESIIAQLEALPKALT